MPIAKQYVGETELGINFEKLDEDLMESFESVMSKQYVEQEVAPPLPTAADTQTSLQPVRVTDTAKGFNWLLLVLIVSVLIVAGVGVMFLARSRAAIATH